VPKVVEMPLRQPCAPQDCLEGADHVRFLQGRSTAVVNTVPVSELGGPTKVNPRTDMAVLCANGHRVVHRRKNDVLSLEALRALIPAKTCRAATT
jgi:hypothetical protein